MIQTLMEAFEEAQSDYLKSHPHRRGADMWWLQEAIFRNGSMRLYPVGNGTLTPTRIECFGLDGWPRERFSFIRTMHCVMSDPNGQVRFKGWIECPEQFRRSKLPEKRESNVFKFPDLIHLPRKGKVAIYGQGNTESLDYYDGCDLAPF